MSQQLRNTGVGLAEEKLTASGRTSQSFGGRLNVLASMSVKSPPVSASSPWVLQRLQNDLWLV